MAEMQKRQACVQAANDHEALKACFPNRGKWGKGDRGGPGGEAGQPLRQADARVVRKAIDHAA